MCSSVDILDWHYSSIADSCLFFFKSHRKINSTWASLPINVWLLWMHHVSVYFFEIIPLDLFFPISSWTSVECVNSCTHKQKEFSRHQIVSMHLSFLDPQATREHGQFAHSRTWIALPHFQLNKSGICDFWNWLGKQKQFSKHLIMHSTQDWNASSPLSVEKMWFVEFTHKQNNSPDTY